MATGLTTEEVDAIEAEANASDKVSFSRLGFELRQPTFDDSDLAAVAGRTVVVTGATAGLGRAAVERFAELGARVVLVVRDEARGRQAAAEITAATGNGDLAIVHCDLSSLDSVRSAARTLLETEPRIHVLVNNAGILIHERRRSVDGYELVLATNLLGPFLLTELLLDRLIESVPARIIEVSSGGMYSQRIDVDDPQTERGEFIGNAVYSRTKRGQVIITEMRAQRLAGTGVVCHSMHPGWAATPGVASSIPVFEAKFRDILRTPAQGADTIVWLGAAEAPAATSGQFWLDRRVRETHRSDETRETAAQREALWTMCRQMTGLSEPTAEEGTRRMSGQDRHDYVKLLDRIIAAAEAGDASDIFNVYAEDAVIWHNHDNKETTVAQNARLLEKMDDWVADRQYTDRRVHIFDGGVVQQHVLRGVHRRTGEAVSMNACVVVLVNEQGRVTRLDEYLDSAEAAKFRP